MMRKKGIRNIFIALFLALLMLGTGCFTGSAEMEVRAAEKNKDSLEVHFLDVGQGDATLILSDGHAMLIDAGNNSKGTAVQSYLQNKGVKKLDYVIGTHPDADHIGGLDVVIYKFDCGKVFLPDFSKDTKTYDEVVDTLKEKNYKAIHPKAGERYQLGDASFTITAPNGSKYDSANDYSIAVRLEHGKNHFLFVGDAEEESEQEMLHSGQKLDADVYKVSHHGSRTGTSEEFLDAVSPKYAVISCGEDNSYGHPHAEVMNLLRREGVKVFRTDEQGTIVAVSDGKKITWNMSPDESWKAGEPKGAHSDAEPAVTVKKKAQKDTKNSTSYILNTNTKKIHLPSCKSVKRMSDKNKEKTSQSIEELKKEGYTPCQNCLGK
ncbi:MULTISPECIES: ComEC/Rec2 family competence protein [Faecalicatena]|nr:MULTISPECIES: ComEC/Rec2 family competence protein [Faecalicatena]MCI6465198.1 MBL fold metallo-hydrolase [Faecalicatena sp.]MDY5621379.1 ComEC/Rec2 family competence protein [Lachnospiraceae bacterium]